jgi:hypothetical protein
MRGAWTALRRIVAPVAWKTASNDAVKFEPRSRIRNLMSSNRSSRLSEVAGLLHGPLTGRVRGDAAEVHPAGAVLDEHQDVQPCQQHGAHVQEVDREDPGGLGMQELAPGGIRAARRRIDARSTQDLPHRRRCHRHAELRQLAMYPAVTPQRILLRQAHDKAADARKCWRAAGLTPLARVVLLRGQLALPGQQRRWRDKKDPSPAAARYKPSQRSEPGPVSGLVPHPAGMAAQHCVLVPEHKQFSILRPAATEHQDSQADYRAHQQVDDLQQHPASQPSLRPVKVAVASVIRHLSIRAAQDPDPAPPARRPAAP